MVYASPIDEGWATGHFYDRLGTPYYLSPDKVQSDYAPVRFARELKLFRRFCRQGTVLDVGCSTGAFLFQLQSRYAGAYELMGTDVAGPALDYAEKMGIPVLRQPFLSADFGGRRFSAVTFWAVLEHLAQPREFLLKAASLLEPAGFCFILVPNFRSLATRCLGGNYRYIFPQHINYFTPVTLRRLAGQVHELRPVFAGSMHFNPVVLWQDWRRGSAFVANEERAALLKRTTALKQNPILGPLKLALAGLESGLGWLNLADNLVLVLQRAVDTARSTIAGV